MFNDGQSSASFLWEEYQFIAAYIVADGGQGFWVQLYLLRHTLTGHSCCL